MLNRLEPLSAQLNVSVWRLDRLLRRYGSLVEEVLAAGADEPELLTPVAGAPDYINAEIRYAVTHEGALHLDDVLTRRTRISIEYTHRGTESARPVADV